VANRISKAIFVTAACAALLAGCGVQDRQPQARLSPGYGLFFNQDSDSASLAYGRANSDEVGLMLQCVKGSRQVEVSDVVRSSLFQPDKAKLTLVSDGQTSSLAATLSQDEAGAPLARARTSADNPVLKGFRHSGKIAVRLASGRYSLAATAPERTNIARFLTACGAS
jgi:hypothetical protein